MPGGEAAIREPWRMAVSYLAQHYGPELRYLRVPFLQNLDPAKVDLLLRMMERKVNSPLTSSCGRLFDAVAALAGIRREVNYEAQAAIELEMQIEEDDTNGAYPFELKPGDDAWTISTRPMFDALISDLEHGKAVGRISARFHNGLVAIFTQVAQHLRSRESLDRICLSGGSFHNVYLLEHLHESLTRAGFGVFTHKEVPTGDGGLSLGQALVAAHQGPKY